MWVTANLGRFEMGTCSTRVLMIGAGMVGSTAARRLAKQGIGAVIADKGRGPVSGARVDGANRSGLAATSQVLEYL